MTIAFNTIGYFDLLNYNDISILDAPENRKSKCATTPTCY